MQPLHNNISPTLFLFKPEGQDTSMKKHEFMYSCSAKNWSVTLKRLKVKYLEKYLSQTERV